jgi:hypothetical protein
MKGFLPWNAFQIFLGIGRPVTGKTPVIADRGNKLNTTYL